MTARTYLTALLYAPVASFGRLAVGERRDSDRYPTRSQLIGLLGASLGVDRADEAGQAGLRDGYSFALQIFAPGRVGTDFHTAQTPSSGKVRYATRRAELSTRRDLNTVLTYREFRFDCLVGLAISAMPGAPYTLEQLAAALRAPYYALSLGRKCCALGLPLQAEIAEAVNPQGALGDLWRRIQTPWHSTLLRTLAARPGEIILERHDFDGEAPQLVFVRDQPISRRRWQFGLREAVILPPPEVSA